MRLVLKEESTPFGEQNDGEKTRISESHRADPFGCGPGTDERSEAEGTDWCAAKSPDYLQGRGRPSGGPLAVSNRRHPSLERR